MARRAKTKATRGKLERALIELESFAASDDVATVIPDTYRYDLARAISTVQKIESYLYNGA